MSHNKSNRNKGQAGSEPKMDGGQKESTNRHVYVEPGVQIDVVKGLKEQHQSERAEDATGKRRQLLLTGITGFLVLVYTGISACQLKVSRDTFNAANRPYVGVDQIGILYYSPDGAEPTRQPTSKSVALTYSVEVKNFGPVPGTNFEDRHRPFVGGKELTVGKKTEVPCVIFPTQSFTLEGAISGDDYRAVMDGNKLFTVDVNVEYDGPSGHYQYCESHQFAPNLSRFLNLGPQCRP